MKKKGGYHGTAGMHMPKKKSTSGMKSLSNYGDMSKNMGGVSCTPTTSKRKTSLKGTSNSGGRSKKY